MAKPTPVLRSERWTLDLRWAGLGQYKLLTPGVPELAIAATQEAYEVYERERTAAAGRLANQGSLFAGPGFRVVARDAMAARRFRRSAGRTWAEEYNRRLAARWGHVSIAIFNPPGGDAVIENWRDEMAEAGLSPKTRRNYLNELFQVLRYAEDPARRWLARLPRMPDPCREDETLKSPEQPWITEGDFRNLRATLYRDHDRPGDLCQFIPDREARLDFIARRRLYLSFAFYTGMHVKDLDSIDDGWIGADLGDYRRRNNKSSRVVDDAWLDCPEPLHDDVRAEVERLGRPFRRGELICGGPWPKGADALTRAAELAGVPLPCNFRSVLRRSTAREYMVRGWPLSEVAHILGHVDDRMLRQVYATVPPRHRSPVKIPWDRESTRKLLGGAAWTSRAKVVPLRSVPLASDLHKDKA